MPPSAGERRSSTSRSKPRTPEEHFDGHEARTQSARASQGQECRQQRQRSRAIGKSADRIGNDPRWSSLPCLSRQTLACKSYWESTEGKLNACSNSAERGRPPTERLCSSSHYLALLEAEKIYSFAHWASLLIVTVGRVGHDYGIPCS